MESNQRDLPPPSTLGRMSSTMSTALPPFSYSWQGTESMQHWLVAKAEEDRRASEQEKTRQESLRLEQRKVEHAMLMDALRAGVPLHMVPFIFCGGNGHSNSNRLLDILQQYPSQPPRRTSVSTASHQTFPSPRISTTLPPISQQPSQVTPPEPQRDARTMPQNPFGASTLPARPVAGDIPLQLPAFGAPAIPGTSVLRPMEGPTQGQQYIPTPQTPQRAPVRSASRTRRSSPSISFHHWVPPGQSQSQGSLSKGQTEPNQQTPSQSTNNTETSPSRKRKSISFHHHGPPSVHSSDGTAKAPRLGAHSPTGMIFHNFGPHDHQHQKQRSGSVSQDSQPVDEDSDYLRKQRLGLAARAAGQDTGEYPKQIASKHLD